MKRTFIYRLIIIGLLFNLGCKGNRELLQPLASIDFSNRAKLPGDSMRITIKSLDGSREEILNISKDQSLEKSFAPGDYRVELDLLMGSEVKYSSNFCSEAEQESELHKFKTGSNQLFIIICDDSGVVVEDEKVLDIPSADAEIEILSSNNKTMFVDQTSQAMKAYKESLQADDPQATEALKYIAEQPTFIWLSNDWIPADVGIMGTVREYKDLAQGKTLGFILYDVPGRDCGNYSSGGVADVAVYLETVQEIIDGLDGAPAIVILEPDALPLSLTPGCEDAANVAIEAISRAVDRLAEELNIKVYIDAGNPRWIPAEEIAPVLKESNIVLADGFTLNISNYISKKDNIIYGKQLSDELGGKKFLVDTSRNGRGALDADIEENWCNPPDRALGTKPTQSSFNLKLEAYIWAKRPGESDGTCRGGAEAGTFIPEKAIELYVNAKTDGTL